MHVDTVLVELVGVPGIWLPLVEGMLLSEMIVKDVPGREVTFPGSSEGVGISPVINVPGRGVTFPGSNEGVDILSVTDVPGRLVTFPESTERVDIFSD